MVFTNLDDKTKKYILLAPKKFAAIAMQACLIKIDKANPKEAAKYLSNAAWILDMCAKSLQQNNRQVIDFKK